MIRRRFLAARARYRCEWKCTRCGRMNRERGATRAADRVAVGQYTDNLPDEVELSGQTASEMARRKLFRLQERVNADRRLQGLSISGVCRKCGARQFWAPASRHAWAAAAGIICMAVLLWCAGVPENADLWFAYGAAVLLSVLLAEGAVLEVIRWRLNRLADPECAPWVEEIQEGE